MRRPLLDEALEAETALRLSEIEFSRSGPNVRDYYVRSEARWRALERLGDWIEDILSYCVVRYAAQILAPKATGKILEALRRRASEEVPFAQIVNDQADVTVPRSK